MPNFISEDDIERAILKKLNQELGFELLNCYTANSEDLNDGSNRINKSDVILKDRLKEVVTSLNPNLPESAIDEAISKLMDKRRAMSPIAANREIDSMIRDGVPVEIENAKGKIEKERVRLIDFNDSSQNRFLAVSQLWIKGDRCYRRPDIILYINGIPLVFIELKNSNVKLQTAFDDNLTNYKTDIPQLFLTNAVCILSNAIETKVGSFTADWEHFFNWLRTENEKEKIDAKKIEREATSLERAVSGLCAPERLLDFIENFIVYHRETEKIVAQNHQFIGVNKAFRKFLKRKEFCGKLGVFWHTQGAGKSFSMIFYVRKIFRKVTGNFTFAVITDRKDLDGQIYRNFLNTGTVKENEAAQPKDSEEMRKFLEQNKRVVFTLIHKFRYDKGKDYPILSNRDDIVVMVDEAHRTQYESLAENMRNGLPNANYLAFTGTPLLGRERKTSKWFGDYVSEYNFQQSMDDGATVPLFYQKRVPEVLIQNQDLSDEFYEILEDENLNEAQQLKLEKKFAQEIEVIKRDDRLETIAKDIVYHFPRRGYLGKGMVVSLDKFTAVRMYDKVQRLWKEEIKNLRGRISKSANDIEKARLKTVLDAMRGVEMAVVISIEGNKEEEKKFSMQELDLKPHVDRLSTLDEHGHDIEYNFKDPEHPLQLVFVCAMWLTGFDAPTVSTLYLDKPMKDHTLMQAIARANRVTSYRINDVLKRHGDIVDYYNVFRNMKKALKDYAQGEEGLDDPPIREKSELFRLLEESIQEGLAFCRNLGIDLNTILDEDNTFKNINQFKEFADILLSKDKWRKQFFVYDNTISSLYSACKPEILKRKPRKIVFVFQYLRDVIDTIIQQVNIDKVGLRISELLDESVVVDNAEKLLLREHSEEYQIVQKGKVWDLSKINFDKLKEDFARSMYKNIEIADLRAFIQNKIQIMIDQNVTRKDFAEKLQEIIDTYNSGGSATENYFDDLMKFTQDLKEEDERHIREELSADELELFDVLKKEKMTKEEEKNVKLASKSLLNRLLKKHPKLLVQDWYKDSQSLRTVRKEVEDILDKKLPKSYDRKLFKEKCDDIFDLMVDYAAKGRKWAA